MPPRAVRRSSRSSARPSSRPSGRPACLPRMPHGPHHLICSPLALPCSSHPFPTGLAACLIGSPCLSGRLACLPCRLIGSPLASYRLAPRSIRQAKRGGAKTRSSSAGCHCRRIANGGRCRGCLLALGLRCGRGGSAVSFHLIGSPIGYGSRLIQSSNRRGGGFFSFSPDPPPACSSLLACLRLFPRPRPGEVRAAVWLVMAGVRAACLRSSSPVPLSRLAARSLVAICPVPLVPFVPAWGVVGRFMGYSARYLVGVGVSQNMPLNGILWLLTGIFGDVVRCFFSSPLVASSPRSSTSVGGERVGSLLACSSLRSRSRLRCGGCGVSWRGCRLLGVMSSGGVI